MLLERGDIGTDCRQALRPERFPVAETGRPIIGDRHGTLWIEPPLPAQFHGHLTDKPLLGKRETGRVPVRLISIMGLWPVRSHLVTAILTAQEC